MDDDKKLIGVIIVVFVALFVLVASIMTAYRVSTTGKEMTLKSSVPEISVDLSKDLIKSYQDVSEQELDDAQYKAQLRALPVSIATAAEMWDNGNMTTGRIVLVNDVQCFVEFDSYGNNNGSWVNKTVVYFKIKTNTKDTAIPMPIYADEPIECYANSLGTKNIDEWDYPLAVLLQNDALHVRVGIVNGTETKTM